MKKYILLLLTVLTLCINVKAQSSCATALSANLGTTNVVQSPGTVPPAPAHCQFLNGTESFIWYTYTAAIDTTIEVSTITTTNTGLDTRISVFSGTCGALSCIAYGDDESAFLSSAIFNISAGSTYYIVFDSYWGDQPIDFTLSYVQGSITPPISFTSQPIPGGLSSKCVVDMNNDKLDDIVVPSGNNLTILYQSSVTPGTFTTQTYTVNGTVVNSPSWSIAGGDMDNNGYTDLIYGGGSGASIIMANSTGTGYNHFSDGNYIFSQRTNVVDIDNNGVADAFVCHDVDANVWYESNGNGTFVHHQGGLGPNGGNYGSVWIDYDNDCDIDLFIAKCGSDAIDQLHRNDGSGSFTSVGATAGVNDGSQTWSSAWADYDNDGDMDLFIGASSGSSGSHKFYRNNGDGTFTNITAGSGFDLYPSNMGIENLPADFNNDGYVDVYGLGGLIMYNNGDMTFSGSTAPTYSGATGDLNHDGYIDIVNGSSIYFNDGDVNNYLTITTVGTTSNKQGIGARITLSSAMGNQIRDVRSAEAFSSMQTLNAHFGLGQDTQIDYVSVCWPSGIEDMIMNPTINSHITINEGSTVGIEEFYTEKMKLYPNPANEKVYLDLISMMGGEYTIQLMDMNGKLIQSNTFNAQKGKNEFQVSLNGIETGIYMAVITNLDGVTKHLKFVKE